MNEAKVQPKFSVVYLSKNPPDDPEIEQLKYWCRRFAESGLMPRYEGGTFGNLSFRRTQKPAGFIITASGLKADLTKDSFVSVDSIDLKSNTVFVCGSRPPSSESLLHFLIYQRKPEIKAIFHGHSIPIMEKQAKLNLPITLTEEAYGTKALAASVLAVLAGNQFIIMKNHGFISLGRDLDEAGQIALDINRQ